MSAKSSNSNQIVNINAGLIKAQTIIAENLGITSASDGKRTFALSDHDAKRIYIIDAENMEKIATIQTDGTNPYPIDLALDKLFVSTRGSSSVDVVDVYSHKKIVTLTLQHTPRSSTFNGRNYMAIAGNSHAYTTIVDVENSSIVGTYGPGTTGAPTDFGGGTRCGHPNWLDNNKFIMCDRTARKLRLFDVQSPAQISEFATPTSVHHIIADSSSWFYAVCEGNQSTPIYPGIIRFRIDENNQFVSSPSDYMELNYSGSNAAVMGCHHMLCISDNRISICSTEGKLFLIDKNAADWGNLQNCITNGSAVMIDLADGNFAATGCGHFTPLVPRVLSGYDAEAYPYNRGFSINHSSGTVTLVDIKPSGPARIHTIQLDDQPPSAAGRNNIGHTSWFSRDGTKFYCIASRRGELVEISTSPTLDVAGSQSRILRRLLLTDSVGSSYVPQGTGWDGYAKIAYTYQQTEVM